MHPFEDCDDILSPLVTSLPHAHWYEEDTCGRLQPRRVAATDTWSCDLGTCRYLLYASRCDVYPAATLEEVLEFFRGKSKFRNALREPIHFRPVIEKAVDFGKSQRSRRSKTCRSHFRCRWSQATNRVANLTLEGTCCTGTRLMVGMANG